LDRGEQRLCYQQARSLRGRYLFRLHITDRQALLSSRRKNGKGGGRRDCPISLASSIGCVVTKRTFTGIRHSALDLAADYTRRNIDRCKKELVEIAKIAAIDR
jgi:hypothetical protein